MYCFWEVEFSLDEGRGSNGDLGRILSIDDDDSIFYCELINKMVVLVTICFKKRGD